MRSLCLQVEEPLLVKLPRVTLHCDTAWVDLVSASPWCHLPSPALLEGERTQLLITPGCCTSHTGISKRPRIRELSCFAIAGKNREASKGQDCFPELIRCHFRAVGAALHFAVSSNPSAQPWDGRARQPRHHIPGLVTIKSPETQSQQLP